jgi:DNA-binding transcriptional MerR regulator
LLTVGLVACRGGLTTKVLRHYDRFKLLRPAAVDEAIGYRLYRSDQVAEARLAGLLRSLDLPLDQVRTPVGGWKAGDAAAVSEVIRLAGGIYQRGNSLSSGMRVIGPRQDVVDVPVLGAGRSFTISFGFVQLEDLHAVE